MLARLFWSRRTVPKASFYDYGQVEFGHDFEVVAIQPYRRATAHPLYVHFLRELLLVPLVRQG